MVGGRHEDRCLVSGSERCPRLALASSRGLTLSMILWLAAFVMPASVRAQTHEHGGSDGSETASAGTEATRAVHDAMMHGAHHDAHLELTPTRTPSAADSARARTILSQLKQSIARYRDYRIALAEGYEPFLPNVRQAVYHFTSARRAIASSFRFDPTEPTSLLYEKTPDGYRLVGAMYTAPKRASADDLNERVPLSIAQWHAHVNICVPKASERQRWREMSNGQPKFGPAGAIATEAECGGAGGRWFPQLFGWMVHVNPFEQDPTKIWGTH